jgi:hypothetical protein
MAGSVGMHDILELLMNELLSRKEGFLAIFSKLDPVIQNESKFLVAFFFGYMAHSYKEIFSNITNREMREKEIDEMLEFLMENETRIREALAGKPLEKEVTHLQEMKEQLVEDGLQQVREESVPDINDRVNTLEQDIEEVRREVNVIKQAARHTINRYEVKLIKRGKFEESVFALTD